MNNELLKDTPTLQIGKVLMTKELSEQIGLEDAPFEVFGIKTNKDFNEVVSNAVTEIISIREVETIENSRKFKTHSGGSVFMGDRAFEVAESHNKSVLLENRLKVAEYTLKQLFPRRDISQKLCIAVSLMPGTLLTSDSWGYSTAHIEIIGNEVKVTCTF